MTTMNSFDFLNHRVTKLHFDLNDDFQNDSSKGIEVAPEMNLTYQRDDENKVIVNLSIRFKNLKIPFFLEVVLSGLFQLNYEITDKKIDKLAHINIAAVLFPFLRQIVADTTMKAGFSPLLLPVINFVESYKDILKQKEKNE